MTTTFIGFKPRYNRHLRTWECDYKRGAMPHEAHDGWIVVDDVARALGRMEAGLFLRHLEVPVRTAVKTAMVAVLQQWV